MKSFLITCICMMLLTSVANAFEKPEYFQKGAFFSVDLSAGNTFNERVNTSYGIDNCGNKTLNEAILLMEKMGLEINDIDSLNSKKVQSLSGSYIEVSVEPVSSIALNAQRDA